MARRGIPSIDRVRTSLASSIAAITPLSPIIAAAESCSSAERPRMYMLSAHLHSAIVSHQTAFGKRGYYDRYSRGHLETTVRAGNRARGGYHIERKVTREAGAAAVAA